MIYCPDCGTANEDDARFCDNCGRSLQDVAQTRADLNPRVTGDHVDHDGRLIADDGLPVGEDLDGLPGGERLIWRGRPHWLWSPRKALMTRYRLTNQRLIAEKGFISRRTDEVDLFRVDDVGVTQGLFGRLAGYGNVFIASSDKSAIDRTLINVDNPDRVKDLVREAARQERQRRRVLLREDV